MKKKLSFKSVAGVKKMTVLLITATVVSMMLSACSAEPVEITVPADMLGLASDAGIVESADAETVNEDGSVTYVIPKKAHAELLGGVSASIDDMIAGVFAMEESKDLFDEIEFNDDYTALTLKMPDVIKNQFSVILLYPALFTALTYQQFNGLETISVTITATDSLTGEVLESSVP